MDDASAYSKLVVCDGPAPALREKLAQLGPEDVLIEAPADLRAVRPLLAGLWLWHDGLHESHEISQALPSATGSFWHAIMHRREGDFSNAKYWYARCRHHPALPQIATLIRSNLGEAAAIAPLHGLVGNEWNPDAFVDVVEAVHRDPADPLYPAAVRLQRLEWRGLFEHCLAEAVGSVE